MSKLSAHFHLDEMITSQVAMRRGIDNVPNDHIVGNLALLCADLEAIRVMLGNHPIIVTSGYRSPKVNELVGGSPKSAHVRGLAADFICPRYGSPMEIVARLASSGLLYDQMIHEGGWVHYAIAAPGSAARREILTAHFHQGGEVPTYSRGLV